MIKYPSLRCVGLRSAVWLAGFFLILFAAVACHTKTVHTKVPGAAATAVAGQAPMPGPIDPPRVEDEQDMTWNDYPPVPWKDWADPSLVPSKRQLKIALVAGDFPDQPFLFSLPK